MGFIRGGLLVIVITFLFLSIFVGNFSFILTSSLKYENVQPQILSIIDQISLGEGRENLRQELEEQIDVIESDCKTNSEYIFNYGSQTFQISCESINEEIEKISNLSQELSQDEKVEILINETLKGFVKEIYYQEYDCNYWDCFEKTENPLFLVSEKSRDYWKNIFYISLGASLVLIALSFFLMEKKTNLPILVGSLLIISSLPLMKLNTIMSSLTGPLTQMFTFDITSLFFSKSYSASIKFLIMGIIILAIGILLKVFKIGFKISEIISKIKKDKEKSSKKEIPQKNIKKITSKEKGQK